MVYIMKLPDIIASTTLILIWGTAYTVAGYAINFVPAISLYAIRFLLAGLFLLPFSKLPKIEFKKVATFGIAQGFVFFLIALAMQHIDTSLNSIIISLEIPFTILMAALIFKEKITWNLILGLLLCFFAIYIISDGIKEKSNVIYVVFLIFSATIAAFSNIVSKSIKNVDATSITCYSSFFTSAVLFIFAFINNDNIDIFNIDIKAIILIIYLAVSSSMLAYQCFHFLLKRNKTTQLMPLNFLKSVISVLSGYLILNEPLNIEKILGLILIIIGVSLAEFNKETKS